MCIYCEPSDMKEEDKIPGARDHYGVGDKEVGALSVEPNSPYCAQLELENGVLHCYDSETEATMEIGVDCCPWCGREL